MRIRAAVPDDAENISRLVRGLSEEFIAGEFTARGAEFLLNSMSEDSIRKYIQSGYRYHVAELNGKLAGVVAVKNNTHLYHLFVARQYHRRGIAKKLWQIAMDVCLDKGNPGVFTVNSSKFAIDVYQRLGFAAQEGPQIKNGVVFFPMKLTIKNAT